MYEQKTRQIKKNSIILYGDYADIVGRLPIMERGRLLTALLDFARFEGTEMPKPTFRNAMTEIVYTVIMGQLLRDRERYDEVCALNRAKAQKRWAAEKGGGGSQAPTGDAHSSADMCRAMPTHAARCHTDTDIKTDAKTETDTDTEREKETDFYSPPFMSPHLQEGGKRGEGSEKPTPPLQEQKGARSGKERAPRTRRREARGELARERDESMTFDVDEFYERALERSYGKKDAANKQATDAEGVGTEGGGV